MMPSASARSTTSIVKGFSPSQPSSSYRSIPLLTAPSSIPSADLAAATTTTPSTRSAAPKKPPKFALGGSSGEDSLSEQPSMDLKHTQKKKTVFTIGGSSNEDESSVPPRCKPTSALSESLQKSPKKVTSFQDEVAVRTIREEQLLDDDVFETDDEIDESAIEEDDSSDWEDSVEDSAQTSADEKPFLFQRVDSRANLTSRRSMITTLLHQNDRANELAQEASKSTPAMMQRSRHTSPNGPSLAASPIEEPRRLLKQNGLKPVPEIPRSAAQPIIAPAHSNIPPHFTLSPRTTRRNMLAHELTVSLRQHLLWERQHKAQFRRRHTAQDLANLKQYPEKPYISKHDDDDLTDKLALYHYYSGGFGEYNVNGW